HIRTLILTFFYRQMRKLIEDGHLFVARPPLFKVEQKKNVRYVQTLDEMGKELIERGLDGTRLQVGEPAEGQPMVFTQDKLGLLVQTLAEIEQSLVILERRGLNVATLVGRIVSNKLPIFRVLLGNHETWYHSAAEAEAYRAELVQKGKVLLVAD